MTTSAANRIAILVACNIIFLLSLSIDLQLLLFLLLLFKDLYCMVNPVLRCLIGKVLLLLVVVVVSVLAVLPLLIVFPLVQRPPFEQYLKVNKMDALFVLACCCVCVERLFASSYATRERPFAKKCDGRRAKTLAAAFTFCIAYSRAGQH